MSEKKKNGFMDEFFSRHYERIRKMAEWLCYHKSGFLGCHDAEEITQQVCLKLFLQGPEGLARVENEEGYIYRTVQRCYLDLARQRTREISVTVDVFSDNLIELVEDTCLCAAERDAEAAELVSTVKDLLDGMSATNCTIGSMYFFDGCTQLEIAGKIGKAQSTVAEHLDYIRRFLREGLRERLPDLIGEYKGGG